jgi:hypothetical protein
MLEGTADGHVGETNGDGSKSAHVELRVSLHNVEGTLQGEGVIVAMDAGNDLAFLCIRVRGDGEVWAFSGGMYGLRGWCTGERDGRGVDESDGGGGELCLDREDLDVIGEGVWIALGGDRHVVVVWKCCCR